MRFYFAILISLTIHVVLNLGIRWLPAWTKAQEPQTIEVVLSETKSRSKMQNQQQIVRDSILPEHLKAQDDKSLAQYLSAQTQRVKKEMRAAESGLTQNRSLENSKLKKEQMSRNQSQQKAEPSFENSELTDKKDNSDYLAIKEDREPRREFAQNQSSQPFPDLPRGTSTTGEYLPERMEIGSFTSLNTDRFTYYTFYARVEELVRFRWESKVRQALQTLDRVNLIEQIRGKNWVTYYEFWIEPSGKLHSAHLMKESGIKRFDLAAEFAFRDALVFPNPPKALIEDDGFIKLRYTFNVHWNGQL